MVRVRVTAGLIVKDEGQGKGFLGFTSWHRCSFPHSNHCRGVLPAAASASLLLALCTRRNPRAVGGPKSTMAAIKARVRVRVRVGFTVRLRVGKSWGQEQS
jgi:hypothetical protein